MPVAVHVIWWVTIGLALILTIFAAGYLASVVRVCGQIMELARATVPAAVGIKQNTSAIANLAGVLELAPTLLKVAGSIDRTSETIASTIESVAPKEPS